MRPSGSPTYLEDLREEARADFLAEKVVDAREAGHRAPQRPVRGRPHAVGGVHAVHGQLVRAAVTLLGVAEVALRVVVHGARCVGPVSPLPPHERVLAHKVRDAPTIMARWRSERQLVGW